MQRVYVPLILFNIVVALCAIVFVYTPNSMRDVYKEFLRPFSRNGPFVDLDEYPELAPVTESYAAIKQEYASFCTDKENKFPVFAEFDLNEEAPYEDMYERWRVVILRVQGVDVQNITKDFPRTLHALDMHERNRPWYMPTYKIRHAMFSILEPGKHILPHVGAFRSVLRYHLPIDIPYNNKNNECWLRVNGIAHYWKNGEPVLFDDTFVHEAANGSDQKRVVFFVDIEKHFPLVIHWIDRFVTFLIQSHTKFSEFLTYANTNI